MLHSYIQKLLDPSTDIYTELAKENMNGKTDRVVEPSRMAEPFDRYITKLAEFSSDMYRELAKENPNGNLVFSPYSIESALMMAWLGARGDTRKQILRGMRMDGVRRIGKLAKEHRRRLER